MLERIAFERFRILRDVDVELEPFTVVVGANSSGKTTFLRALEVATISLGAVDGPAISRDLQFDGALHVRTQRSDRVLSLNSRSYSGTHVSEAGQWTPNMDLPSLFLSLEPAHLRAVSYEPHIRPELSSNGSGLASVLADLKLTNEGAFYQILEALQAVVPSVQGIRLARARLPQNTPENERTNPIGFQVQLEMHGAEVVSADHVSDGTLLTLGLLTALQVLGGQGLILWDDIERGLHPAAMEELVQQIRKIQERQPKLQIIATSHSPYMVGHFKPEEVRLTALRKDGTATIGKLTDHPDFERWDGYMDAGEFWSAVGENWLTEDDPEPAEAEAEALTA